MENDGKFQGGIVRGCKFSPTVFVKNGNIYDTTKEKSNTNEISLFSINTNVKFFEIIA